MKKKLKEAIKLLTEINIGMMQLATVLYLCRRILGTVIFVLLVLQSFTEDIEKLQAILATVV